MLDNYIENGYVKIRLENRSQREAVQSKKRKIFGWVAGGATVLGGIASFAVAGPLGLGLYAGLGEAGAAMLGGVAAAGLAGGGITGLSVGASLQKWMPRKWFGEQSALKETVKRLKKSAKQKCVKENAGDDAVTSANTTADEPSIIATVSDHAVDATPNNTASNSVDTIADIR